MTKEELFEKYNIVHVDGCRYYIVDLKTKAYDFECTIPYCLTIYGVTIFDSSWKNLIPRVVEELDSKNPKSKSELLSMSTTWSKQCVFGEIKKSNFVPYKDIYINANHTALHAMWIIQLLLHEYNVDLDKCEFVIKRQPAAEPSDVRKYFKEEALNGFERFLKSNLNKDEKSINNILKNFEYINQKVLPIISNGYSDLFLIEDPSYFFNYSKKIVEQLKTKIIKNEVIISISRQLGYLYDYVKITNKENKLKYIDYNYSSREKDNQELKDFLDDFDSII